MNKVSAIIISMNKPENVIKLAKKLKKYFDEIIILDNSKLEFYYEIKKHLEKENKIRIFNFPPLGTSVFFYYIGFSLCKYRWIFIIEDDENINDKSLYNLSKNKSFKSNVFTIVRKEDYPSKRFQSILIRFFNKNYVTPIGIIHWHYFTKEKPQHLNKVIIFHNSNYYLKKRLKNVINQTFIDSYQFGYKLLLILNYGNKVYKIDGNPLYFSEKHVKMFRIFFKFCSKLDKKLGMIFFTFIISFLSNIYIAKKIFCNKNLLIKDKLMWIFDYIIYNFLLQFWMFYDTNFKVKIWYQSLKKGGFIKLFELTKLRKTMKFFKSKNITSNDDGIHNFKKFISYKKHEFYKKQKAL
ncbi:MAG: glycosyltransferase [Candidatus Aenigmatarchaeota archaeon]